MARPARLTERLCIVRRKVQPVDTLLRFVVSPERELVPDIKGVLPGRGIWVSASREAVLKAIKGKLFARAARAAVIVDDDLPERIDALLCARALSTLSLARKAGAAVAGFEKVAQAIGKNSVLVLVTASDASPTSNRKLVQKLRLTGIDREHNAAVSVNQFTANQLGIAFGVQNVVHAGVLNSGIGGTFAAASRRCAHYGRGSVQGETVAK